MPGDVDAEHIPHFALVPVGRRPEVGYRRYGQHILGEGDLEPYIGIARIRAQLVDDGKCRVRLAVTVAAFTLINRGQIEEHAVGM